MTLELLDKYADLIEAEAACRWVGDFCRVMDPAYESAAHAKRLCEHLEAVERREIDRLMVFMPPRHSKSYHVSQRFPAWYLGRHPDHQVILASYGADLAEFNSRIVRNLISDQRYPFATRIAEDSRAVTRWATEQGGVLVAAGVGGPMTGFGANLLDIDDPIKDREQADSEVYRERVWQWYTDVARTRLMPAGSIVLTQTRWHENDLAGRVLNSPGASRWTVLEMPALDPDGRALWPSWYDVAALAEIRETLGSRGWNALYQQRPSSAEGGLFKRAWFNRRWRELPELTMTIQAVDSAFKDGVGNDYSVIATWGTDGKDYYLIDLWRQRVEYPDLERAIIDQYRKWSPAGVLIEDTASGQVAVQMLQRTTMLPAVPVKVTASKSVRAGAVAPVCEANKVVLPDDAPWVSDWIDEHASFPQGTHDDMVDTTSMALGRLRQWEIELDQPEFENVTEWVDDDEDDDESGLLADFGFRGARSR